MRKGRVFSVVAVLALFLAIPGCRYQQAKSSWQEVLVRCGAGDVLEGGVFFGPSDQAGPGSIWRRTDVGTYRMRWSIVEANRPGGALPVEPAGTAACKEPRFTLERLFPTQLLMNPLQPMDAELEDALNKVDKVTVRVQGWAVDRLAENAFGGMLKELPAESLLRKDLGREAIMAQVSGVRVAGFAISLDFAPADAERLRQKYKDLSIRSGKAGASFSGKWTSPTVLELAADKDIYIFGRLSQIASVSPEFKLLSPSVLNVFGPEYEDPSQPIIGETK